MDEGGKREAEKEKLADYWKNSGLIRDERVIRAFMKVKREQFVLKEQANNAYLDIALPIIEGQTISQPSTVMIMSQALEVCSGMKVLEIGAGSGYQAAILSLLVGRKGKVYTTEISHALVEFAKNNLREYKNVEVIETDGSSGLKKHASYHRIIVTAAAPSVPEELIKQLKNGGILVIPVGDLYMQNILKVRKLRKAANAKEAYTTENLGNFMFVPLRGKHGFRC
ncbi:protein-L-isoaspartate(D-aspartate) O-methyltransferase [archaeon]|nr:protein-L-isoaspartate(D-aspartate) O-methyltransferase [archaeon]